MKKEVKKTKHQELTILNCSQLLKTRGGGGSVEGGNSTSGHSRTDGLPNAPPVHG